MKKAKKFMPKKAKVATSKRPKMVKGAKGAGNC